MLISHFASAMGDPITRPPHHVNPFHCKIVGTQAYGVEYS